jgi:transposase
VKVAHTVENLYDPVPSSPSDYKRSIEMSYDEMMEAKKPNQSGVTAKKGKQQVHQLGEQPVQSVPPLKVFDEKAVESSRQYIDYPIAEVAYKFVQGKDLVENLRKLPTSMRNLHVWYINATKRGINSIIVRVKEEHYFQEYSVSIDFSKLFQLYNLGALDKSIISCYCL